MFTSNKKVQLGTDVIEILENSLESDTKELCLKLISSDELAISTDRRYVTSLFTTIGKIYTLRTSSCDFDINPTYGNGIKLGKSNNEENEVHGIPAEMTIGIEFMSKDVACLIGNSTNTHKAYNSGLDILPLIPFSMSADAKLSHNRYIDNLREHLNYMLNILENRTLWDNISFGQTNQSKSSKLKSGMFSAKNSKIHDIGMTHEEKNKMKSIIEESLGYIDEIVNLIESNYKVFANIYSINLSDNIENFNNSHNEFESIRNILKSAKENLSRHINKKDAISVARLANLLALYNAEISVRSTKFNEVHAVNLIKLVAKGTDDIYTLNSGVSTEMVIEALISYSKPRSNKFNFRILKRLVNIADNSYIDTLDLDENDNKIRKNLLRINVDAPGDILYYESITDRARNKKAIYALITETMLASSFMNILQKHSDNEEINKLNQIGSMVIACDITDRDHIYFIGGKAEFFNINLVCLAVQHGTNFSESFKAKYI